MQSMFEENQNWQMKLIDNKIGLDPNAPGTSSSVSSTSPLVKEEPVSVKTEISMNGTEEMEVQEDKENQASLAKKVKRNL